MDDDVLSAPSGQALSASPTEPVPVSALSGDDPSREFADAIVVFNSAARILWDAVQADQGCTMVECVFKHGGNCECVDAYSALAAQAIPDDRDSDGSGEADKTRSGLAVGDSAGRETASPEPSAPAQGPTQ